MYEAQHILCCCCCCFNLTIATRWIGFCGVMLSTALTTVIINDKMVKDYEYSRNLALALGLDWQHLNAEANAAKQHDPDGKLISIIMVFYSVVYLLTNMVLIFASITENRWCTIPWFTFEFLSCISKIIAMIVHHLNDHKHFLPFYYIGSIIYVVVGYWWCLVVYSAQNKWATSGELSLISPQKECISLSRITESDVDDFAITMNDARFSYHPMWTKMESMSVESIEYVPNSLYSQI